MTLQEQFMLPCLNKKLFGIECLGCGMQRSLVMVFQGDFAGAFQMYPGVFTIILLVLFVIFNLFKKFKNDYKIKMGLLYLNIIIIVVSYIIKITH